MPKRLRKPKTEDSAQSAFRVLRHVVERTEGDQPTSSTNNVIPITKRKNPAAVALGRMGGLKSAEARMEKIPAEVRRRIASKAARVRWAKAKGDDA